MIWTGFRASDDPCQYNYLIADEMMAVVALGDLVDIERDVYHDRLKAGRARTLRAEVQNGIRTFGEMYRASYGYIYAYEVDGFGHAIIDGRCEYPESALRAVLRIFRTRRVPCISIRGASSFPATIRTSTSGRRREESAARIPATATFGRLRSSCKVLRRDPDEKREVLRELLEAIRATICSMNRLIRTIRITIHARISAGRTHCSASSS